MCRTTSVRGKRAPRTLVIPHSGSCSNYQIQHRLDSVQEMRLSSSQGASEEPVAILLLQHRYKCNQRTLTMRHATLKYKDKNDIRMIWPILAAFSVKSLI